MDREWGQRLETLGHGRRRDSDERGWKDREWGLRLERDMGNGERRLMDGDEDIEIGNDRKI